MSTIVMPSVELKQGIARLVILPQWLLIALEANNLTKEHALDVTSLQRVFSLQDVGFYVAINTYLFEQINASIRDSFDRFDLISENNVRLSDNHGQTMPADQASKLRQKLFRIVDEYYVSDFTDPKKVSPQYLTDKLSYDEVSRETSMAEITENYLFDVVLIKDDIYGITYRRRDESISQLPQLIKCYDNLLKLLSGIHGFQAVAGTPVFNEYAALSRRIAVW